MGNLYIYRGFGVTKWLSKSQISRDLQLKATWAQMYGSFGIRNRMTWAYRFLGIR